MHDRMRSLLYLSLFSLIGSGCITIQDGHVCAVAGDLSYGANCAHLTSSETNILTLDETLDLLNPQEARKCVPVPGYNVCQDDQTVGEKKDLPARGGAVMIPADDFSLIDTELREACRELGSRCSYATQEVLKKLETDSRSY